MIKLAIVEDHALFRLGLKAALKSKRSEISVVGEAEDGKSLFALLKTVQPDIIVLDVFLPDISGVEVAQRLRKEYPEIKILAISAENNESMVQSLIDARVDGFISKKQSGASDLIIAIQSIMNGVEYFGQDIAVTIYNIYLSRKDTLQTAAELTSREKEIIDLCRAGLFSKEIAAQLNISQRTVDSHKNNIFKKMGIKNSMEMVQYALKHGIIQIE